MHNNAPFHAKKFTEVQGEVYVVIVDDNIWHKNISEISRMGY